VVLRQQVDQAAKPGRDKLKHSPCKVLRNFLLKRGDPDSLAENDLACIRYYLSYYDLHECGFANAISSYNADPFSPLYLKGHTIKQLRPAKGEPQSL
jgi:hypothetical protein